MWLRAALVLALLAASAPADARAQIEDPSGPTWDVELGVDLTAALGAGLISVGWLLANDLGPPWCAPECDPDDITFFFDRPAAGNYSLTWAYVSDAALLGTLVSNLSFLLAEEGVGNALTDLVVIAQSMLFTNMSAILAGLASRRPRPYMYGTDAPEDARREGISAISFFCGHCGAATAFTTATFLTLRQRDPDSSLQWVALAVGGTLALVASVGRIFSGDHFPSDVLIGIAMGISMGVLFPALHDSPRAERSSSVSTVSAPLLALPF